VFASNVFASSWAEFTDAFSLPPAGGT